MTVTLPQTFSELQRMRRRGIRVVVEGPCQCCGGGDLDSPQQFVVDHCHEHDYIRGIICRGCNGYMSVVDNPGDDTIWRRAWGLEYSWTRCVAWREECPECRGTRAPRRSAVLECTHTYPDVRHIFGTVMCRHCG